MKAYTAEIQQAFRDWHTGLAFLSNDGHFMLYRRVDDGSGAFRIDRSKPRRAPWSKAVKAEFNNDCSAFHRAGLDFLQLL